MKRLLALLFAVASLSASAQTIITPNVAFRRVGDLTNDTFTFGAGQCNDTITVQWTNTTTIAFVSSCSSNSMKVWSTAGECANTPGTGDVRYDDIPGSTLQQIKQGTFNVKLAELPGFSSTLTTDGGMVTCGTQGLSKPHRLCGAIEYTVFTGTLCGSATTYTASPLKLNYDTLPPGVPQITATSAEDQGVKVSYTVDSDASLVQLEVRAQGDTDFTMIKEATASNNSISGTGLVNNTTYDVRLRAVDAAGNISDPSPAEAVTPIKTLGFYGYYRSIGGSDRGCSAGWGIAPALGLWLLVRARQRRRTS